MEFLEKARLYGKSPVFVANEKRLVAGLWVVLHINKSLAASKEPKIETTAKNVS